MPDNVLEDLSNIDLMVKLELGEREKIEASCSFKHYDEQEQIIDRQSETTDVFFYRSGDSPGRQLLSFRARNYPR